MGAAPGAISDAGCGAAPVPAASGAEAACDAVLAAASSSAGGCGVSAEDAALDGAALDGAAISGADDSVGSTGAEDASRAALRSGSGSTASWRAALSDGIAGRV